MKSQLTAIESQTMTLRPDPTFAQVLYATSHAVDCQDADNMQRFELLKADDIRFNDPRDSRNMSIVARVRNRIVRAHDQSSWELSAGALY